METLVLDASVQIIPLSRNEYLYADTIHCILLPSFSYGEIEMNWFNIFPEDTAT